MRAHLVALALLTSIDALRPRSASKLQLQRPHTKSLELASLTTRGGGDDEADEDAESDEEQPTEDAAAALRFVSDAGDVEADADAAEGETDDEDQEPEASLRRCASLRGDGPRGSASRRRRFWVRFRSGRLLAATPRSAAHTITFCRAATVC